MSNEIDTRYPVDTLWVDTVTVRSVNADWETIAGEGGEGFTSYEAPSCPQCDTYATWDANEKAWRCLDTECATDEIDAYEDETLTGPMMNYYYPLPDLRRCGDDPNEAASAISHLPLCVVEFADETYALALTGGGMDLSWEICEAFTRLGFLPPLHFADLPRMEGHDDRRYVIDACKRSAEVAEGWARSTRERLYKNFG